MILPVPDHIDLVQLKLVCVWGGDLLGIFAVLFLPPSLLPIGVQAYGGIKEGSMVIFEKKVIVIFHVEPSISLINPLNHFLGANFLTARGNLMCFMTISNTHKRC